jgi:hypothetical protein
VQSCRSELKCAMWIANILLPRKTTAEKPSHQCGSLHNVCQGCSLALKLNSAQYSVTIKRTRMPIRLQCSPPSGLCKGGNMTLGKRTDYGDAKYAGLEVALPQDVDAAVQVCHSSSRSNADRVIEAAATLPHPQCRCAKHDHTIAQQRGLL